ncbi:MAG: redoxin domain-containing protein [Verrucomicrobiales bacterium]
MFSATAWLLAGGVAHQAAANDLALKESGDSLTQKAKPIAHDDLGIGMLVRNLELEPIGGKTIHLADLPDAKAIAILFTSSSCPVSKKYGPTLSALEQQYQGKGVSFIYVNPMASEKTAAMESFMAAHKLSGVYIHDKSNVVAKALAARSTTEAFILDSHRTLLYRGAIDDQYGVGFSNDKPTRSFFIDALENLLAGRPPAVQATTAPGCALETESTLINSDVALTYHGRISRIIQNHCVECHRPGGVAPFSLQTYEEVRSHAGMIRKVVDARLMPPWFAKPGEKGHPSPWANDRSLLERDRNDLLAWLSGAKEEGNSKDAPPPLALPAEWQIGSPDVIVQIPEPIQVKASGKMPYQDVYVPSGFTEDKWVSSLEVKPTAPDVVHHVLVFARKEAPQPGAKRRRGDDELGNFLAVYVPGNNRLVYPAGFAKHIPAGSTLHFQIHYTPKGIATNDQTRVGMIFSKEPPKHEVRVAAIANTWFKIPPNADNYEVKGVLPVAFPSKILAFMPHMHLRGKSYRYELAKPDGTKTTLLDVPRYDFNWQLEYRLKEPLEVEPGSRLLGTAYYDNSTGNPANPDPNKEVKWGPQTDDEMMLGYLEYYIPGLTPGDNPTGKKLTERAKIMFDTLDKNGDGNITPEEAPTNKSFNDADANQDKIVTRAEFDSYLSRQRRASN